MKKLKRPVGRPRLNVASKHVQRLYEQGYSFREIAVKTGFGYGTVRRAYWAEQQASAKSFSQEP